MLSKDAIRHHHALRERARDVFSRAVAVQNRISKATIERLKTPRPAHVEQPTQFEAVASRRRTYTIPRTFEVYRQLGECPTVLEGSMDSNSGASIASSVSSARASSWQHSGLTRGLSRQQGLQNLQTISHSEAAQQQAERSDILQVFIPKPAPPRTPSGPSTHRPAKWRRLPSPSSGESEYDHAGSRKQSPIRWNKVSGINVSHPTPPSTVSTAPSFRTRRLRP